MNEGGSDGESGEDDMGHGRVKFPLITETNRAWQGLKRSLAQI